MQEAIIATPFVLAGLIAVYAWSADEVVLPSRTGLAPATRLERNLAFMLYLGMALWCFSGLIHLAGDFRSDWRVLGPILAAWIVLIVLARVRRSLLLARIVEGFVGSGKYGISNLEVAWFLGAFAHLASAFHYRRDLRGMMFLLSLAVGIAFLLKLMGWGRLWDGKDAERRSRKRGG